MCPKCHVTLLILEFKGIEVDMCDRCRGVWLDAGELEELIERTGASMNDPLAAFQHSSGSVPRGRKCLCPRCDLPLEQIRNSSNSLVLDRCREGHGLWFDVDELQKLLAICPTESGACRALEFLNELFGTRK